MKNNRTLMQETAQKVSDYINAHEEEIFEEFKALIRIPSYRGKEEPGMPFGRGCAQAVEASAQLYERNGFSVLRRVERGYALAETGGSGKALGVFCHCDVVNPDTGVWEQISDPFAPEIKDGYLIGRGTSDDKCAVIAALYALNALKSAGIEPKHRIQVYLGSNEEDGMEDVLNFRADLPMPDVSLVPDCRFPMFRGEKSYARFEVRCSRKFQRILSFTGGSPAGVCGDAVAVLPDDETLKAELAAALKGRDHLTLSRQETGEPVVSAKGRTTHPAAPLKSVNAGALLAEALLECPSLGENDLSILKAIYEMTANITGEFFSIEGYDADFGNNYTVCCEISQQDGCVNMDFASFYSPVLPYAQLKERIRAKCSEIGWTQRHTDGSEGYVVPQENPIVQLILHTYQDLCRIRNFPEQAKEDKVSTFFAPTYARHLKNGFCTGFSMPVSTPPAGFSPGHGSAHQSDECISISAFKEGILFLAILIAAVDRDLDRITADE